MGLKRTADGAGGFSRRFRRDDRDDQSQEEEDDGEAEGEPGNDFLRTPFLGFGEDVEPAAGDGARSPFRFTALEKGQNDDDQADDDEYDVIPCHSFVPPLRTCDT